VLLGEQGQLDEHRRISRQALPGDAFDMLVRMLARICDDPYDRLLSMPAGKDPHECMAELDDSGFIVFTVDDDAGLIRVYGLVWIG
jgi:hypothetical protein